MEKKEKLPQSGTPLQRLKEGMQRGVQEPTNKPSFNPDQLDYIAYRIREMQVAMHPNMNRSNDFVIQHTMWIAGMHALLAELQA